jgi:hypothetical protein
VHQMLENTGEQQPASEAFGGSLLFRPRSVQGMMRRSLNSPRLCDIGVGTPGSSRMKTDRGHRVGTLTAIYCFPFQPPIATNPIKTALSPTGKSSTGKPLVAECGTCSCLEEVILDSFCRK